MLESTFYCTFVRIDITLSIELSTMVTMAVLTQPADHIK